MVACTINLSKSWTVSFLVSTVLLRICSGLVLRSRPDLELLDLASLGVRQRVAIVGCRNVARTQFRGGNSNGCDDHLSVGV